MKCLPENYKIVQAIYPATTNGGITGDYVSLKYCNMAYIKVALTQAVAHETAITVYQATAVDGTDAKAIANVIPIWANEDTSTSDTLTRQTDAVSYTVAETAKNKEVLFQVAPALLDTANNFDCLNVRIADSEQATNLAYAEFILDMKYKGTTPPTAITD